MEKVKRIKSLKNNAIFNVIKTITLAIIPLIIFKHISNIFLVDDLGKINFSNSLVNYFTLIASLGIPTYAIRECSKIENKEDKDAFISEMFFLNLVCTLLSYLLLFGLVFLIPAFKTYVLIILVTSISILFTTLGMEWVNSIDEDFLFLSLRTLVFQIISLILTLVFVKDENDLLIYLFATVFVVSIGYFVNFFFVFSKHKIRIKKIDFSRHLVPVLILFFNTIAITIYSNSDVIMLTFMCGDYETGIYGMATKIYFIVKSSFGAIIAALLPRLSLYYQKGDDYNISNLLNKCFKIITLLILPAALGIFALADDIVYLIGGTKYAESIINLRILSISLLFAIIANFISVLILIPERKDKTVLVSTLIGASVNIILNIGFIYFIKSLGASITTLIAEIVVCTILFMTLKKKNFANIGIKELIKIALALLLIALTIVLFKCFLDYSLLRLCLMVFTSIVVYFSFLLLSKEEIVWDYIKGAFKK